MPGGAMKIRAETNMKFRVRIVWMEKWANIRTVWTNQNAWFILEIYKIYFM